MSLDAKLKQSLLETAARHRLRRGKSGRQTARNLVDLTCTLKKKDLPEYDRSLISEECFNQLKKTSIEDTTAWLIHRISPFSLA